MLDSSYVSCTEIGISLNAKSHICLFLSWLWCNNWIYLKNGHDTISRSDRLSHLGVSCRLIIKQQGVAVTGRNTTGPPCSRGAIIRLEASWRHRLAVVCRPAMQCYRRRRQTPTNVTSLPPTLCVGGPVTLHKFYAANSKFASEMTMLFLIETFCLPLLRYAFYEPNYSKQQLTQLNICWNKAYSKAFHVNNRDSMKELQALCGRLNFMRIYDERKMV